METYTGIKVKLTHLAHDWARGERKAHFIAAVHQFHRLLYFFPSSWLYSPFSSDLPVSPQKHYAVNALHLAKKKLPRPIQSNDSLLTAVRKSSVDLGVNLIAHCCARHLYLDYSTEFMHRGNAIAFRQPNLTYDIFSSQFTTIVW